MSVRRWTMAVDVDGVSMAEDSDGHWVRHADYARLRAAVAALMATGDEAEPWWGDWDDTEPGMEFGCDYCACEWAMPASAVTHAPDCPAMAIEAAMREVTDEA